MRYTKRLGVLTGLGCFATTLALLPVSHAMAEEQIEEVIVTGSYIKRDSFDSASPLTVVDQASIAANATPNLGEVLATQTFNYGTDFQTNTYSARGQLGNISQANLRGLGPGATLDLIDGKRTNNPFLSNSMPQIAIQRIDILKDGASALYGTDAVAGVVNLITRKSFTGITTSLFHTQDDTSDDYDEQQYEILAGAETENGHITIAGRYATRGTLQQVDRPRYLREGFERSGTGNPGDWLVPVRDGTGAMVDQNPLVTGIQGSRQVDPGCGVYDGPGGSDAGSKLNHVSGDRNGSGTNCRLHFGEWWNYMNPQDQYSMWMNYSYDFSTSIRNELELTYSRLETESRGSIQNPGGRTEEFPIVAGDHPGNPFRAFGDTNANGTLDPGEQLFAMDANGDGVPDRGTVDMNGDGLMDVLLNSDPFSAAGGGIAFNEDVDVVALRAMGKLGTQASSINSDTSNTGNATFDQTDFRIADTLTIEFANSWELQLSALYERWDWVFRQKNTSQSALINGLNGTLKPDPTVAGTSYWNPFSTQQLSCTDRVCSETGTADFANTLDVMNAVNIDTDDVEEFKLYAFSAIATGDIYELPAGMIAGAIGVEYRKDERDTNLNAQQNRCDWHEGGCGFDWNESQDVNSVFFELIVPVLSEGGAGNLELQLAGRYVDYGGSIGSDFNPKFAALWQPIDWLSIRGSWSSAFIAPTLEDQFEPEDCGLQTANDPITGDASNSFRVACVAGNSALVPETADVWNIGFSVSLLEGDLTLGLDYSVFDFTDRIAQTALNNVITQDFNNFVAAGLTPGDPADVLTWLNSGASDPAIIRDTTGVITRVVTTRLNATQMKHKAYDFYGRYNLALNSWGTFNFDVNATYVDEYTYDLGPGLPSGDAAGSQNEQLIDIPPIPQLRVTSTINWDLNNQSAMIRVRWIDEFDLSFNSSGLMGAQLFFNGTGVADSITYTDVKYAYAFPDLLGNDRETRLEVGGRNIFDEFPDPQFNLGGIETFVHDIRGAMWYVRVNQDI